MLPENKKIVHEIYLILIDMDVLLNFIFGRLLICTAISRTCHGIGLLKDLK